MEALSAGCFDSSYPRTVKIKTVVYQSNARYHKSRLYLGNSGDHDRPCIAPPAHPPSAAGGALSCDMRRQSPAQGSRRCSSPHAASLPARWYLRLQHSDHA